MSAPHKLRPAPDSQLRKLKELPPQDRAEVYSWRGEAGMTNAAIRERIGERFGISLKRDEQLSEFWQWQFGQAAVDSLGDMMSADEQQLADKFPNLTLDSIRKATIKRSYAVAALMQEEHPELGLKVVSVDLKDKASEQEDRKIAVLERKAALLDQAKGVMEDKELTEAQRAARMREVFGIA